MIKNCKANFKRLAVPLTSLIILTFLTLQAVATFRILCPPPALFPSLSPLRILCAPALYPFLDYPLYAPPHYEGDTIDQRLVFGVSEDLTEAPILPEELGLSFFEFEKEFLLALRDGKGDEVNKYVELYQRKHNKKLIGLRLENHPLVLSREGVKPGPKQILENFQLKFLEDQKWWN